mgnify:FL=1
MLRKFLSLILAALTLLGVIASFSCSNQNTTADNTSVSDETSAEKPNTSPTTTPANTEETTAKSDASNPVNIAAKNSEGYIFESYSNWNYKTFVCPYTDGKGVVGGGEPGGHFEAADDEMAAFVTEKPEWYKDTKLMESWDSADAPFGDRIAEAAAADTPFISDKENVNGLMVYKTFDITDLSDDMLYSLNVYYDNTVYLYINGKLYFKNDANCGSGDWNGDYDTLNYNADTQKLTLKDFLVIGKNYIACYM